LFEEEGSVLRQAAITYVTYPVGFERTVAGIRAGTCLSFSIRHTNLVDSTEVPSQTWGSGRGANRRRTLAIRPGRLVSTWKMCCGEAAMTSKASAMKSSGTRSLKITALTP
jgi:hypothetical protein